MKCESLFSVLLSLFTFSSLQAREVIVDDPGTGNTVHLMQQVPNVLGYPEDNDPTLKVTSNVPVSVLRYYDASYLEGQQPVQKQDIYIIAKSNCSSMLDVRVDFTEYDRSNFSFWDTLSYTESISIDIIPSDDTILTDNDFLEPSTFLAYWNYSSFWCNEGVPGFNDTVGVDPEPVKPLEPIIEEITPSPAPVTVNIKENELPDDSASATLPTDSAPKSGMLMTALAGLFGSFMMFRDTSLIRRGSASMLAVFALVGALVVSFHMMQDETASHHAIQSAPQNIHGRRLQEQVVETCSASVEIIIDGCRRSMLYSRVDMEVEAPTVRILGKSQDSYHNPPFLTRSHQ